MIGIHSAIHPSITYTVYYSWLKFEWRNDCWWNTISGVVFFKLWTAQNNNLQFTFENTFLNTYKLSFQIILLVLRVNSQPVCVIKTNLLEEGPHLRLFSLKSLQLLVDPLVPLKLFQSGPFTVHVRARSNVVHVFNFGEIN